MIPVNDPANGKAPFAGNIIPASRLDPNGLILLKILPLPNFVNPTITGYNYNYQIQEVLNFPKRTQLFRIDYVPTDKDRIFVRGKTFLSEDQGYAVSAAATPTGFFAQCYCFSEEGVATGWTHIFSPTVVSEFQAGVRRNHEGWKPYNDTARPRNRSRWPGIRCPRYRGRRWVYRGTMVSLLQSGQYHPAVYVQCAGSA